MDDSGELKGESTSEGGSWWVLATKTREEKIGLLKCHRSKKRKRKKRRNCEVVVLEFAKNRYGMKRKC